MGMKELGFRPTSKGSKGDWREDPLANGIRDAKAEPTAGEELWWMNQERERVAKAR